MTFRLRDYRVNVKELHDAAYVVILKQHMEYYLDKCRYNDWISETPISETDVEKLKKEKENVLIIGDQQVKLYNFKEIALSW